MFLSVILTLFTLTGMFAQYTIKGTVFDKGTNETLIAANVQIKGTSTGTTTDFDGTFTLTTLDSCTTLEVTYLGYEKLEITNACTGKEVKAQLVVSQQLLESVEVSGARHKESLARRRSQKQDMAMSYHAISIAPRSSQDYAPNF